MTQTNLFPHVRLDQISDCCQAERRTYYTQGTLDSPACVELFRRAWAGDQEAWAAISAIFEPLMRAWIGVQSAVEPDDVLQEALLAFARWAPTHAELLVDNDLRRPLAFLRQCTKTALLMQLRGARRAVPVALEHALGQSPSDFATDLERRILLYQRMQQLLPSPTEQQVATELLIYGLRPQEIYARHTEAFADMRELRTVIQRVLRRLRADPDLQSL
ncbi:MAG: sigma-70 family RNA polymerase sigma factor [Chloroflexi bacterium]|nr:sigma-70 family RNA polymerase sigma factor [Chloroflexota bacterium]